MGTPPLCVETAKILSRPLKKMEKWRLADPKYVDFTPTRVEEAIIKFRRMQEQGLSSWKYPEAFVECAKALGPEEMGKFEDWLVCPQGPPSNDCVDVSVFSTQNEETHRQLVAEASKLQIIDDDDEKTQE